MMFLVRKTILLVSVFIFIPMCTAFREMYEPHSFAPNPFHHIKPRTFNIFSKPPEEDPPPKKHLPGGGLISHIGNVLHGGAIGLEIRPLAPIRVLLDHAKKILPGGGSHGTVGVPSHEKPPKLEPPKKDGWLPEPPKKDPWQPQPPKKDDWKPENPHKDDWEASNDWENDKPNSGESAHWDDIGEYAEDTGVPNIGDIINPRLKPRPKRYIESKVYRLPLKYVSNGRPYQFKFNNELPRLVKRRGPKSQDILLHKL